MSISWNKSLYSRLNKATREENMRLCRIIEADYPELYEGWWGCIDTVGERKAFVDGLKNGSIDPSEYLT
jgi:hypothetical protein